MNIENNEYLEKLFEQNLSDITPGVLDYKHLYDNKPENITKNISLYVRSLGENYNKAIEIYDAFNFNLLFGEYNFNSNCKTSTMFRESLITYFEKYKRVKIGQMLGLAFEKQINLITEEELVIKCNKTKVTFKEVMFFVKLITYKIICESKNRNNDYCTLHRNFFLKDKSKKDYKKITGRKIGPHKISHITKLLEKYELIVIYPSHMRANKYRLGVSNPYQKLVRE